MSKLPALIKLAKRGDADKLAQLLHQEHANVNQIDPKSGKALIHLAIENSDQPVFKVVVARPGADLQLPTTDGETPLQIAVRLNDPVIVGRLLDLNVNFRKKNTQGETVLHTAVRNPINRDILKRLTTNKFDINEPIQTQGSYLNLAITSGQHDSFYFLIKELNIDYTKKFDNEAVKHNRGDFVVAILQKLQQDPLLTPIDRQFFINHQNNLGNTAIHQAALSNHQTITNKLETAGKTLGLDLSIRNKKGLTVEDIKANQEKERINQIEMQKRRAEQRIVRKKQKTEEKARLRQQEQREQAEQLRRKKEEEKRQEIQTKVNAETQKKKTLWIIGILVIIALAGMYLALTNAIQKKKAVTL